jgi:Tfp pilus assembly protein PilF
MRLAQGDAHAALDAYQRLLDQAGDRAADAHLGQARAYAALGRVDDAIDSFEIALALAPANVQAQLDLAILLNRHGRTAAALRVYQEALATDPSNAAARVNLGLIYLQQLGEPRRAEDLFRAVLASVADHHEALANLGLALHDQGRYEEEFAHYEHALGLHPDSVELRWNRALAHLSLGDYARGWPDYRLRLARKGGRDLARFPYPDWDGMPLPSGRLLVLAEQGLGDEIMFASCLPSLDPLVSDVVLECAPRLAPLFARSFATMHVRGIERQAPLDWLDAYPGIAAKCGIGSLPRVLRMGLDAFPRHAGYLQADAEKIERYRARLAQHGDLFTIGLSWRGGTLGTRGALRSMELEALRPLLAQRSVRFVCLQHGLDDKERSTARELGLALWEDALTDIDELAALVAALDLVISVTNTNAHLAGALGRPVWVLVGSSPEWRWLRSGDRTPWYPSARLIRADECGHLDDTAADLARRVQRVMSSPCPAQAATQ